MLADTAANSPPPASEPQAKRIARFEHAASQVAFWQAMQRQIRKDQGHLRYVLPVGAVAAGALYFAMADARVALAVAAIAVSAWLMGLYFTRVRQEEYSYNLLHAEEALLAARLALPNSSDAKVAAAAKDAAHAMDPPNPAKAPQSAAATTPPETPKP